MPGSAIPNRIGRYRIVRLIGAGGMGQVYEAEQEAPIRRRVALKLVRLGFDFADVVARFESERQALAMMDHTGIARVYDAGATEQGRPYFVMELVHGLPITEYCDAHRLSTEARLRLFMSVCDAVHHAHTKGIIHRDLKPSNILVSEQDGRPVAKIIDFGVAKATTQPLTERTLYTEMGQLIGTPEYMSPEQADLMGVDLDTRSDVYALGVTLYELLVGALPFESARLRRAGFEGILKTIREEDPVRPSTRLRTLAGGDSSLAARNRGVTTARLRRELHGDLDWITMRALEKDRARRYQSAQDLREDIERHLKHEPVFAGPPSRVYRTRKFVRRHRVGVAAGSAIALALIAGTIAATIGMVRALRAERAARQEAETAQQTSDFLVKLFEVSDPSEARGNTITAREILDKGAAQIDLELAGQPLVHARMLHTLGEVYSSIGLYAKADTLLQKALAERERLLGPTHREVASTLDELAGVSFSTFAFVRAKELDDRAFAIRQETLRPDDPAFAKAVAGHAGMLLQFGKIAAADSLLNVALAIYEKNPASPPLDLATCLFGLGIARTDLGKAPRAGMPYITRAESVISASSGPDHPLLVALWDYHGRIELSCDQPESARVAYQRAVDLSEKLYGVENGAVPGTYEALGVCQYRCGDLRAARGTFEKAYRGYEKAAGSGARQLWMPLWELGYLEYLEGRRDLAEPLFQRSIAILRENAGSVANARGLMPYSDDLVTYYQACYLALYGHRRAALAFLDSALRAQRSDVLSTMLLRAGCRGPAGDPLLASLHGDPEFERIMAALSGDSTSPKAAGQTSSKEAK